METFDQTHGPRKYPAAGWDVSVCIASLYHRPYRQTELQCRQANREGRGEAMARARMVKFICDPLSG